MKSIISLFLSFLFSFSIATAQKPNQSNGYAAFDDDSTIVNPEDDDELYDRLHQNHTRLLFAPTARPLRMFEGYVSSYDIFFPMVAFGVTDFISMAGGMTLFPAQHQVLYLAPKVTPLHLRYLDVSLGGLWLKPTTGGTFDTSILYAVATLGPPTAALTLGVGRGFIGNEVNDAAIFMIGGELKVARHIKFIVESWNPPPTDWNITWFGFRFFNEKVSGDMSLMYIKSADPPLIPWLGFAYNFDFVGR